MYYRLKKIEQEDRKTKFLDMMHRSETNLRIMKMAWIDFKILYSVAAFVDFWKS